MTDSHPEQSCESLPTLPSRPEDAHKGTFGRITLFGGSPGMSGALCLAGTAALRSGSGLVRTVSAQSTQPVIAAFEPCLMTAVLAGDETGLRPPERSTVSMLLADQDAVGCGPGLGTSDGAVQLLRILLTDTAVPLILDADALNICARHNLLSWPQRRASQIVITPHPGEFARLTAVPVQEQQQRRLRLASEFARLHGIIVVLKGPRTIVTNGTRHYINETGNSGMATGGSGDVLTGIITSLTGQGIPAFESACHAVHVHGLAGDIAAARLTPRAMIASDLLQTLPEAWFAREHGN